MNVLNMFEEPSEKALHVPTLVSGRDLVDITARIRIKEEVELNDATQSPGLCEDGICVLSWRPAGRSTKDVA